MKRVVIIVQGCRQGGANRSLQYLLQTLEQSDLQISVFALSHQGSYRTVFSNYSLLEEDFMCSTLLSDLSLEKPSLRRVVRWLLRSVFRLFRIAGVPAFDFFFNQARRSLERQNFDVAIAFQEGTATAFAAPLLVPLKIAWIHSDYGNYLKLAATKPEITTYEHFHSIVCVSDFTATVFKQLMPALSERVSAIPNVMNQVKIRHQSAEEPLHPHFNRVGATLLCVGRIDPVKRFTAIPLIAAHLKQRNILFRWYLIGDGASDEKEAIKTAIQQYKVDDCVLMLGEIENPYPYIVRSDVLISLSLSEACPLGVQEAKLLHVPVVATDFGSAREFVLEGEGGMVVPFEEMADTLAELLLNQEFLLKMKQELEGYEFDNQGIIRKVIAQVTREV